MRSPAPLLVALVGLVAILIGEQIIPVVKRLVRGSTIATAWRFEKCSSHLFGTLPGGNSNSAHRHMQSRRSATAGVTLVRVEEKSMQSESRQAHWERVFTIKGENEVSWFEENPAASLELIAQIGATAASAIIDIGGGASRLVDNLVQAGLRGRYRSRFIGDCT